jgi:hypothetical protein
MSSAGAPRVVPFSVDAVKGLCPARKMPRDSCPVCSKIPAYAERFEKHGDIVRDDVPKEVERLRVFIDFGPRLAVDRVERCPVCDGLYEVHEEYEYLVNGSEDELIYRTADADAVARHAAWLAEHLEGPAELRFDGERWTVHESKRA